jgi:hypothetical protein
MDPNLLDNLLTAHEAFVKKLDEATESIRKSTTPSADAAKAKEQLLAAEKQRLENVQDSKKQAIDRFDAELKSQTAKVAALEKEIEENRKSLQSDQKEQVPSKTQKLTTAKVQKTKKATGKRAARAKKKSG